MLLVVTAIIVVLFVWGFLSYASKKDIRLATNHIPGPYNIPLLGCLHVALKLNPKNLLQESRIAFQLHGNIIRGWAFNHLYIGSCDAELNEQILSSTTQITKMSSYGILNQWMGIGLLVSNGRKWSARRKIITPAFHFKVLEQFVEIFDRQSSILIKCLAEKADDKTAFNISPYISLAMLDIISETAMGTKVNAQTDKSMPYAAAVNEMTDLMAWRTIRPHLYSDSIFTLLYPHKKLRQMRLIRILQNFTTKVIEERRKVLETNLNGGYNTTHDAQEDIATKKRMALLDILLLATIDGNPLTNEDIREEVDTFMFGGYDTTSSALSFMLHLLSRHPQVQNKILAEIRQVFGGDGKTSLTLMNLNKLKYLECVIKESLRLYPSSPVIGRAITEDFPYKHSKLGNGVIPAGTRLIIFIYNSLRDPRYYKNATDFIPERHEENDVGGPYSYIPFSAGPRNCIGQKFAMYEMKIILIRVICAYELLPLGQDVEPVMSIVLRSGTGMQLGLRKRTT